MNFKSLFLSLTFLLGSAFFHQTTAQECNLKVRIADIEPGKGSLMMAVYDSESEFPGGKAAKGVRAELGKDICFTLPPGNYAIAVYQDINSNSELDKALFGIPKEPFGFSNNPKIVTKAPTFKECTLVVTNTPQLVIIRLKKFL